MKQTATYDLEQIHSIINTSTVVHVSFNTPDPSNPFPVTLPMVGVAASFEHPSASLGEPLDIYLHGYVSSRLMNLSRNAAQAAPDSTSPPASTASGDGGGEGTAQGLPVTISATLVDGLVLTLTPNTHDVNYRSATLFGYANLVTSLEEKVWAMEQVTNSVVRDRWRHTRVPPDGAEMQSTSILRVKVVGGSGKVRVGGPRDELKDLKRDDIRDKVWTGVIPVWECFGDPIEYRGVAQGDGKENRVDSVPEHVREFAREMREQNEKYALAAVVDTSQD
ncbi:flavin-nucleotide-binding protein [Fonsecaea pedrosoi]|nr:flavin-nucleotide-binding protein [Fonsecaea pedrosoi]